MVCYNTKVLDEHLPLAFDVLSDLVLNPLFREEDIEKEKGVILEEIKMDADNPDYLVHEILLLEFLERSSARASRFSARARRVKAFQSRELVRTTIAAFTRPANLLITAAGNLAHERLVSWRASVSKSSCRSGPPTPQPAPATHARIALKYKKELEQVHVCLGVPCYPIPHEDRFACYVLNTLLGGGMSSRLFQNIRERQGLAYAVFSELNPYSDTGCLSVYAGTSLESAQQVVESVLKEFRQSEAGRRSGRRTAPRQGSSEGLADAESGIHFQPHVESGPAGDALPALLHAG